MKRAGHGALGRGRTSFTLASTIALLAGAPQLAEACSVCFGNPDSPHTQGMNNAILFLLAVIVAVLVCFAAFFLRLRRLSRLARADQGTDFGERSAPGEPFGTNGTNGTHSGRGF